MRCGACGNESPANSRFCDHCGTPLTSSCPACGTVNRPDARFCLSCGASLDAATAGGGPAASAESPAPEAERRLVTVLFADLVGFTSLAEDRDPEAVRELLSSYFDAATEIVTLHGGTVEKFIGDAVMAAWGTPIAHEDDAERAVRAALELVDSVRTLHPELEARAGVLTGEAAVTLGATNQGMVAGDLVNAAARLQGVAEAGTVLVGEATRRAAERAVIFEPVGEHSLKGKASPIPAWRALRVVAQRGGQGRADTLEAPFVGRDEELRQLKDVLHAVGREARPRLVSITGPGGIGKSRLVWELEKYVDGVSEPIYWHRGRSPSYGEGITFWALGEMVRRRAHLTEDADEATTHDRIGATLAEYVSDASDRERIGPALLTLLGVTDAPPGGRDALFPAWRRFFERIAEKGTTVLVFEDLQWADPGLLDFVEHLLDWTRGLPIMVVTLARPELFDRRPDWGAGHRQVTSLALEPLTDDTVRQLLDGLVPGLPADAVAAIVGRAEGVPLYAVEMVRGLLADGLIERRGETHAVIGDVSTIRVPDSLRSLIASRLDALGAEERGLLQDASVLGQVFSAEALAGVTGADAASLEPRLRALVRRELLDVESDPRSPERGQYRFVQSLIREIAYGTLSRRDRRVRHLAVARHYEALGDDELAGALASHYVAAHEASGEGAEVDAIATQARLSLSAAADRAAQLGSHDQAVRYLEQAVSLTSAPRERAELFDRAAVAATASASGHAKTFAEQALAAYLESGDEPAAVAAMGRIGRALLDASELVSAKDVLQRAVAQAESLDDPAVQAATLAFLSRAHMRLGEFSEAVAVADRALPIAERLNLDEVTAEAFVNRASALSILGRRRESVALHRAALELAQRLGDRSMELRIRNNYAAALGDDEPAVAHRILVEGLELARDIGDRNHVFWLVGTSTFYVYAEGRGWDEQLHMLSEALEMATIAFDRLRLRVMMGLLESARGERLAELQDDIAEIVGNSEDRDVRMWQTMVRGFCRFLSGRYEDAMSDAMQTARLRPLDPQPAVDLGLRAAIWAVDRDRIREMADAVEQLAGTGAATRALKTHARAATAGGSDAVALFRSSYSQWTELGERFTAARAVVDAAVLVPDAPEIRQLATEIRPLLEELRARPYLGRLSTAFDSAPAGMAEIHRSSSADAVVGVGDGP